MTKSHRLRLIQLSEYLYNANKFKVSDKIYNEQYEECKKLNKLTDEDLEFIKLVMIELDFLDPLTEKNDWILN